MNVRGPWTAPEARQFLSRTRVPLRLACNGSSGRPVLAALWYVPIGEDLWCATPRSARIVSLLEQDPRCSFEVAPDAPPYRGVRGPATARIEPRRGEEILRTLLERYEQDDTKLSGILLERARDEVAIALTPRSLRSWDFSDRMS